MTDNIFVTHSQNGAVQTYNSRISKYYTEMGALQDHKILFYMKDKTIFYFYFNKECCEVICVGLICFRISYITICLCFSACLSPKALRFVLQFQTCLSKVSNHCLEWGERSYPRPSQVWGFTNYYREVNM